MMMMQAAAQMRVSQWASAAAAEAAVADEKIYIGAHVDCRWTQGADADDLYYPATVVRVYNDGPEIPSIFGIIILSSHATMAQSEGS